MFYIKSKNNRFMARIVSVTDKPHFCTINIGTKEDPEVQAYLYNKTVFIEDNGKLLECYTDSQCLMPNFPCVTVDDILGENRDKGMEVGEIAVIDMKRIMAIVKTREKSAGPTLMGKILELVDEMETGGIDLKYLLSRILKELYTCLKDGRINIDDIYVDNGI